MKLENKNALFSPLIKGVRGLLKKSKIIIQCSSFKKEVQQTKKLNAGIHYIPAFAGMNKGGLRSERNKKLQIMSKITIVK